MMRSWDPKWRAIVVALVVCLAASLATRYAEQAIRRNARDDSEEMLRNASQTIQARVNTELALETKALESMAARWAAQPNGQDRAGWETQVQEVLAGHPSLLAIAWVETAADAPVGWSYPPLYEAALRRLHELVVAKRPKLLDGAKRQQRLEVTEAIHVADQGKAFAAYVPAVAQGQTKGLILGIFHLQILLDSVFERLLAQEYSVQLLDGYQKVYERGERKARATDWEHRARLQVFASKWDLRLWPNPEITAAREDLATRVGWGGAAVSILMGGLAWLWMRRAKKKPLVEIPPVLRQLDDKLFVYQAALTAVDEALLVVDVEETSRGRVEWVSFGNEAFAKLLGALPSAVSGKPLRSLLHAKAGIDFYSELKAKLAGTEAFSMDIEFERQDQSGVAARMSAKPIAGGGGASKVANWLCLFHVEAAAEESEDSARLLTSKETESGAAPLEALLRHAPMAALALDAKGNVTHANELANKVLGWHAGELIGTPPPFTLPERAAAQKQPLQIETKRKDGTRLVLELWTAVLSEKQTLLLFADQTNACMSIEDLAEREFLFRSLVESTSTILALLDADARIRYANPAVREKLGLEPGHLAGARAKELFPGLVDVPGVESHESVPHRDGTPREFETIVNLVANSDLRVLTANAVARKDEVAEAGWFLDALSDVLIRLDAGHRVEWMNRAAEDLYAIPAAHARGRTLVELLPNWLQVPSRESIFEALEANGAWKGEISSFTAQGREIVQDAAISALRDETGTARGYVAILRDTTSKKKAVESLTAGETARRLNALGSSESLWDWNLRSNELYLSPRWKEMLGYGESELEGSPEGWWSLVHPADLPLLRAKIQQHLKGESEYLEAEYRARHKNGEYRWMLTRAMANRDTAGEATRLVGLQSDIQEQKESDEQLLFEAFHDTLTGLPNRALFVDRLNGQLARPARDFSVLFCDLSGFAELNQKLGNRGGDLALAEAARRIASCLPPGSFLARHGSDEFVAILPLTAREERRGLADLLRYELAKPFAHQGKTVAFELHVGFAGAREGESAEELLAVASRQMLGEGSAKAPAEEDIRAAIAANQVRVFYHPVITLDTGEIAGIEALVRWQHPQRGLLTPKDFLPAAELSGSILDLDRWVLREACAKAAELNLRFRRVETLVLTVNLSSQHFADANLTARLEEILTDTAINPRYLRLELNEQSLGQANASPVMFENLNRLRVQLSIDDFDAASGALPDFDHLSIDRIKLHGNLVRSLAAGRNLERVRSLIDAAEHRNLQVVAEGVETLEQLAILRELRCHLAQGFYFTHPAPAQDTERLLARSPRW